MGFVILLVHLVRSQVSKPLLRFVIIVEIDIFCNCNLEFYLRFVEMLTIILLFDGREEGLYNSIIV